MPAPLNPCSTPTSALRGKLTDERLADPDTNPDGYMFAECAAAARDRGAHDVHRALRNSAAAAYRSSVTAGSAETPPAPRKPAARRNT